MLKAYAREPIAIEDDKIIPEIRISANNPPINPPFILKRFVFIKSINNKKTVLFKEAIFKKVNGDKGFINI